MPGRLMRLAEPERQQQEDTAPNPTNAAFVARLGLRRSMHFHHQLRQKADAAQTINAVRYAG
jgi:hypothetical protein